MSHQAKEKGELGRKAIAAQSGYMAKAVEGKGCDRHLLGICFFYSSFLFKRRNCDTDTAMNRLLGLRLLIQPNEEKPALFTDPAYTKSCHWNLSTSQITSEYYDGYGWGEVVADGYGIAYMVKENALHFNLTSLHLQNDVMEAYIHEAVEEMKEVFEATIPIKAKL